MEYGWLEPRSVGRDPIVTDTNLAEIDFEDFRNEDLAFAFSCEEEESGESGTDMSICRSELLFSSMMGDSTAATRQQIHPPTGSRSEMKNASLIIQQDSLIRDDDGDGMNYIERVKVNKNNYTLTFSGGYGVASLVASMAGDGEGPIGECPADLHNSVGSGRDDSCCSGVDRESTGRGDEKKSLSSLLHHQNPLTTWSNLGRIRQGQTYGNNNNAIINIDNNNGTSEGIHNQKSSQNSEGFPVIELETSGDGTATTGINSDDSIPMMRSKDSVNNFLKTAAAAAAAAAAVASPTRLASIEERSVEGIATITTSSSGGVASEFSDFSGSPTALLLGSTSASAKIRPSMRQTPSGKNISPSVSALSSATAPVSNRANKNTLPPAVIYPDLDFLGSDLGLWDAFFKRSRPRKSVLLKPPLPLEEYLRIERQQQQKLTRASMDGCNGDKTTRKEAGLSRETDSSLFSVAVSPMAIRDVSSLRTLLPTAHKHLLETNYVDCGRASPITQVCHSLSKLHTADIQSRHDLQNQAIKSMFSQQQQQVRHPLEDKDKVRVVQVREAWAALPERAVTAGVVEGGNQVKTSRGSTVERNMNALNNNNVETERVDVVVKRRSFHPPDNFSRMFLPVDKKQRQKHLSKKSLDFPKSGSQNDLCDSYSWMDGDQEENEACAGSSTQQEHPGPSSQRPLHRYSPTDGRVSSSVSSTTETAGVGSPRNSTSYFSAEYPFQANLCLPAAHHLGNVNFDLTHKRSLFVAFYSSVERLLQYLDETETSDANITASGATYSSSAVRCVLFRELCPALHAIMADGLKREVITSFGVMPTNVWRVVEAVTRQGPSSLGTATLDLVMMLNTAYGSAQVEEDRRKFAGFVAGLINMSCLHVWFSKLKWSVDVLMRFYDRHAFVCALHKETRLLFDELLFCLQRLYTMPISVKMDFLPFGLNIAADDFKLQLPAQIATRCVGDGSSCHHHRGVCSVDCCSDGPSCNCSRIKENFSCNTTSNPAGGKRTSFSRSRIPRPVSLPKRLEAKLVENTEKRGRRVSSKSRGRGRGRGENRLTPLGSSEDKGTSKERGKQEAASKKVFIPVVNPVSRKSRVRDTIRLFDAKSNSRQAVASSAVAAMEIMARNTKQQRTRPPKTGGGESLAGFDTKDRVSPLSSEKN